MPLSCYLKIYPCAERPGSLIFYSTRKGSTVRVSEALLSDARAGNLDARELAELSRLEIWVDDPAAEREEMAGLVKRTNARSSRYRAILVLNLDCNLACPYCFEDPFRGRHYMTPETARLFVDTVIRDRMGQGREVQVDFYGGEALLSLPLLRDTATRLKEGARERGTDFSFCLFTNGTLLTRELVEELLPLGLSGACITIDGPREIHDRQRPFVSGNGSFDTIVRTVKAVHDILPLQIGGNCGPDNYREFPKLLDHLLAEGIDPKKIQSIGFSPIVAKANTLVGRDSFSGCVSSREPWLREAAVFLREEILRRGFATDKPTMAACMVEFENDFVINYDGSLYKCPAFMGNPELCVGTLAEGVRDYSASHNLTVWQNDECLDCAYLPLCFGGCRNMPLLQTGTISGVDCRRDFLDATLEKFILQDLRYRSRTADDGNPPGT